MFQFPPTNQNTHVRFVLIPKLSLGLNEGANGYLSPCVPMRETCPGVPCLSHSDNWRLHSTWPGNRKCIKNMDVFSCIFVLITKVLHILLCRSECFCIFFCQVILWIMCLLFSTWQLVTILYNFSESWRTKHQTEKKGGKAAHNSGTKKKEKTPTNLVREKHFNLLRT